MGAVESGAVESPLVGTFALSSSTAALFSTAGSVPSLSDPEAGTYVVCLRGPTKERRGCRRVKAELPLGLDGPATAERAPVLVLFAPEADGQWEAAAGAEATGAAEHAPVLVLFAPEADGRREAAAGAEAAGAALSDG